MTATPILDRSRLERLMAAEMVTFERENPRSHDLWERAKGSMPDGVPMNWMVKWAGAYPLFVDEASGAHFRDVDGHEYVDLCLGDTGAMAGHGPDATVRAVERQLRRGITHMLPTEDAAVAADELRRRFGVRLWQFTLTATDANRFVIRLAREITGRSKIVVHNHCYHGSVDETFAVIGPDGEAVARRGNIGKPVALSETTRVVEINDLRGIVLPEPGYHEGVRELTRRYGTLLINDETHTICAGPGGYTGAHGLTPDFVTIGKTIGGGIPAAAYGFTEEVADRIGDAIDREDSDVGGVGGTLAGNALSMAAIRATLAEVLTDEAFARMIPLAERFEAGVDEVLRRYGVPWHVTRLGARAEYHFLPDPPKNGTALHDAADPELERFLHLWAMNRGVLMTPFHNMALMSPATTTADVDRHTELFAAAIEALFA
jgi:glutamate-1-semialdehyde 2,1-aminomutase